MFIRSCDAFVASSTPAMSLSASMASAVLVTLTATATRGIEYSTYLPLATGAQKAPAQSILDPSHPSPTRVDTADPIVLFIIQTAVILGISRLLHVGLARIRQPRVISEILGGILLGPTAFGRIPGFTKNIFPTQSLPFLNLVATLGLVLFLFLVGLEVDFSLFKKNFKVSASVAFVGLALPFGLGCTVSIGLFHEFIDPSMKFTHFMLFIGTSMSITAFPVLARILGELELLRDRVAWVTDQIGVNAIFGGFLAGLIMPRNHGFASHMTEKIEDLVSVLFIPIFFAESGLKTNLGLLNTGIIWGWTICVISTAFAAKFIGSGLTAKLCGYSTRESAAVGSLMSCKGLIELIVLSIGLTAGVINQTVSLVKFRAPFAVMKLSPIQVFSIFVLEALLLTFTSTPLTLLFYPPHIRQLASSSSADLTFPGTGALAPSRVRAQITVVLERLDNLGAVMIFTKLVASPPNLSRSRLPASEKEIATATEDHAGGPRLAIDALRLVELTDRTSAVMQASEQNDSLRSDPLSALYATFTSINGVHLASTSLAIVSRSLFAANVAKKARETGSGLIVVPWTLGKDEAQGQIASMLPNPFEVLFDRATGGKEGSPAYASFVRDVFAEATTDVALFLDRGTTAPPPTTLPGLHHVFLAFYGGADDRAALELVLQLVQRNAGVSATVVCIRRAAEPTPEDGDHKFSSSTDLSPTTPGSPRGDDMYHPTIGGGTTRAGDTLYPGADALQSESADEVALTLARSVITDEGLAVALQENVMTAFPLQTCLARLRAAATSAPDARLTVVVGRGRVGALSHRKELVTLLAAKGNSALGVARSGEVRRSLGEVGTAVLVGGVGSNILILQSRLTAGVRKEA
ncbi:hypothetical protein RQP46_009630 [Phenoliferia psychrophenolica]